MTKDKKSENGVQIDLISGSRLENLTKQEKVNLVIEGVRDGKVVILETGLDPEEQSHLIEVTMSRIEPDGFQGVEIETYPQKSSNESGLFSRMLGSSNDENAELTLVGPAGQLETLHKDESVIQTLVTE